jgi:LAO/AO transport system kinase
LNSETVRNAIAGNHGAQAEIITYLENGGNPDPILGENYHRIGRSHRIGITGSPGAGKSSLISRLISVVRRLDLKTAVIACDPSSPYTHGALLGDRTRMGQHFTDNGVFIRSMATRGHLGGMAPKSSIVADFLDICGYPIIIIETVGVGQTEVDVVSKSDTVVVVMTPDSGDSIQMMKAGLLEGADIFCINKSEKPGADQLEAELQFAVSLWRKPWVPPIVRTVAKEDMGIAELYEQVRKHYDYLIKTNERAEKINERYFMEVDFWLLGNVFDTNYESLKRRLSEKAIELGQPPWEVARSLWNEVLEDAKCR